MEITKAMQKRTNAIARKGGYGCATRVIMCDSVQQEGISNAIRAGYRKKTTGQYVPNAYRNKFGWKNTYYQHAVCEVCVVYIPDVDYGSAITLSNWSVCSRPIAQDMLIAPELIPRALQGNVIKHPKLQLKQDEFGNVVPTHVVTSRVVHVAGRFCITEKGTVYKLGAIDKGYRAWLHKNFKQWNWRKPVLLKAYGEELSA